jgi:quinoprotein glucose dehydrogenase
MTTQRSYVSIAAGLMALSALLAAQARKEPASGAAYSGWAAYGGNVEQTRYSSLKQINRGNVKQLEVAWTYDSGEAGGLQTQPLMVEGVLYGVTPTSKPFALRADTGDRLWIFDSGLQVRGPNRGLMTWGAGAERRIFAGIDRYVYALDARTGKPIATFGENGRIDLQANLGRDPRLQSVRLTTPGVVYKDLMIVGGRTGEGLPASPGYVRAYDVRSGALRWTFHTIPNPGETGYDTWSKDSWTYNGGANNWPGMAVDEARGIVYVPTGSAADDFYGANRVGDNLFANCLIALKADTGERLWHFQMVRHDIWDRDPPSPPVLVTVVRNGRRIDAVAQTTKHAFLFLFDRVTGKPLFPIEYKKFPPTDVPGETTADTQPIPTKPLPFARQQLTKEMLTTRTPEMHAWALREFEALRNGGQFLPFAINRQTVIFPGFDGGAEWGGQAFDPETGLFYVNANDLPWTGGLAPNDAALNGRTLYQQQCAICHRDDRKGTPPELPALIDVGVRRSRAEIVQAIRKGAGRMPGFPGLSEDELSSIVDYVVTGQAPSADESSIPKDSPNFTKYRFTGYRKFLDPEGYPAVVPPWGTLNAIDLNSGNVAWKIPLGEYPELADKGLKNTGTENYGGPIVTAGGLVFIGASNHDRKFHAFDKATGALLWEATLPFSGNATPATYEIDGRQFVVIAAGGGKSRGPSGGVYVAFALPKSH